MKWYQIEVFQAVMKTGSMTAAARLLNLSQPSISKHIQALESTIGAKLFVRDGRGITATPIATSMFEEVHVLFNQANSIDRLLESFSRNAIRRFRVGIPPVLSSRFVSDVIARLGLKERPLDFFVAVKDSSILKTWITSGRLDVAIIGDHIYGPGTNIAKSPLVCIMAPNHPLKSRSRISAGDLAQHDYIALDTDSPLQSAIDGVIRDAGVKIHPKAIVTTTHTAVELVGSGLGVSLVHPFALIDTTRPVAMRPFEPEVSWDYKIIVNSAIGGSNWVDDFAEAVLATASAHLQNLRGRDQFGPEHKTESLKVPLSGATRGR